MKSEARMRRRGDVGRGCKSRRQEGKKWWISRNFDGSYHLKMVIMMREIIRREEMKKGRCKEAV